MAYIATSKNSIIIFNSLVTGPRPLVGFSDQEIIEIEDSEIIKATMGCDGVLNLAVVAKEQRGSFNFFSASPSLDLIYRIQQAAYATGLPIIGSLIVAFPSLAIEFTYSDFAFLSSPKGFSAAAEVKPTAIKWVSTQPNQGSLGPITTQILGLI